MVADNGFDDMVESKGLSSVKITSETNAKEENGYECKRRLLVNDMRSNAIKFSSQSIILGRLMG